jgi:rubrerythrin
MDDTGDKIERIILNAVWREGGCEAVEEINRLVRTCGHCGYEASDVFEECPICGRAWKADG